MNWASWSAASVFANSLLSVSGSSPAAPMIRCPGRVHVCRPPACVWSTLVQAASITVHATTMARSFVFTSRTRNLRETAYLRAEPIVAQAVDAGPCRMIAVIDVAAAAPASVGPLAGDEKRGPAAHERVGAAETERLQRVETLADDFGIA